MTQYYVTKNGSDSNNGQGQDNGHAWLTIQKAANTIVGGDTVYVSAGTYSERVSETTSGSSGSLLTYVGAPGVICQGFNLSGNFISINGFEITSTPGADWSDRANGAGIYIASDNINVFNNYIHDTIATGVHLTSAADNCWIRGNRMERCVQTGVTTHGTGHIVEYNEISHPRDSPDGAADADAMHLFGSGHLVRCNFVHDLNYSEITATTGTNPHMDMIQSWGGEGGLQNTVIERNLFYMMVGNSKNGNGCILEADASGSIADVIIRNNVFVTTNSGSPHNPVLSLDAAGSGQIVRVKFYHNTCIQATQTPELPAIDIGNWCDNVDVKNNIFYNFGGTSDPLLNTFGANNTNITLSFNCVFSTHAPSDGQRTGDVWMTDPLVLDLTNRNYRLKSTSPCIGVGGALGGYAGSVDYDGNPRVQNWKPDMGAFEHTLRVAF